ncbi:MAG: L,D-transpeptidase family protein [Nitrospiraceae bacterium]|nr:L,D-transpeptidase family protein [Nitrospiraceae bacterium]
MRTFIASASSLFIILFCLCVDCYAAGPGPCAGQNNRLVVDTARHLLRICQGGSEIQQFRVSLGRGGIDKTRRGDDKTPLGEYPLGNPKPSPRFGTFIPIGYPTPAQHAEGYSGGDVGVHGPSHIYTWFENIKSDWTLGCIAVGSGHDISAIAQWVKEHRGSKILIR